MRAAFFLLALTAVAQNQTGSLSGVVVDSVTHQPLKKALVTLNRTHGPGTGSEDQGPSAVVTDATGSFTFEKVAPGQASITVQHTNYPQTRSARKVEIKAGETVGPVTLELIPGATISGHVADEDGDPLLGCFVMPHPAAHPEQQAPSTRTPTSDVDGEYRISGVQPGKYILSIECRQPVFQPRPFSAGPDPPPARAYPAEYYPAVADAKSAQVIDAAAGAEKSGVDFQMKPEPVTQVRGTFAGDLWRGQQNLQIMLMNVDPAAPRRSSPMSSYDPAKGAFAFQKVFPGSYLLLGFSSGGDSTTRIGSAQRIEVKDQPVETAIEWRQPVNISGTIEIENPGSQTVALNQISVQLTAEFVVGVPLLQAQVQDDGSFTLSGALPSTWRIRVQGPRVFLKSAWAGTDEITGRPLDLIAGAPGPLRLMLSTNMATVQGTGPLNEPVVLEHVDGNSRESHVANVDQTGHYSFAGLVPGTYRIMLGASGPLDDDAKQITVEEGQTLTVDLKN